MVGQQIALNKSNELDPLQQPTPIPLAQPRLGSWPAAAEQAVERLRMRMVEDGNGRARAGRGRRAREWRGAGAFRLWRRFYKVVTACAWEARGRQSGLLAEKDRWSGWQ
uniref:Uncharacterized protein n=1 Tax=Oryza punctata TaxID=4537 RepID=A0A0E0K7L1_ORYPU